MLYPIYVAFKHCLNTISEVKTVQLYNKQFESTITTGNAVLIAFEPVNLQQLIKEGKTRRVTVHLYIFTKALSSADGSLPDETIRCHDELSDSIIPAVDSAVLPVSWKITLAGYALQPIESGFLVSRLDYEVRF